MSVRREFDGADGVTKLAVDARGEGRFRVRVGDREYEVTAQRLSDGRLVFELEGRVHVAAVGKGPGTSVHVRLDGHTHALKPHEGHRRGGAAGGGGAVEAPMTGTVVQMLVRVGDGVVRGQTVGVLTAMKMEHKLLAGVDGTVAEVNAEAGITVEQGTLLVRIEAAEKSG